MNDNSFSQSSENMNSTNTCIYKRECITSYNVIQSSYINNSIIQRVRQMKSIVLSFRIDYDTLLKLYDIMEKIGVRQSDAIRYAIATLHSILSNTNISPTLGRNIVIQNPVVNLNLIEKERVEGENTNILKLKKEIEKLNKELEKLVLENVELKNENEELKRQLRQLSEKQLERRVDQRYHMFEKIEKLVDIVVNDICKSDSNFCNIQNKKGLDKIIDAVLYLYNRVKKDVDILEIKKKLIQN